MLCACFPELKIGQKLNEGKTKQIFELLDQPGLVLVQSKDQITAGNAVRKDQMEGKAAIANKTTSCVFQLLRESGEDLLEVAAVEGVTVSRLGSPTCWETSSGTVAARPDE